MVFQYEECIFFDFFKERCSVKYNLSSNILPCDVKLSTCDWNLVIIVWEQWQTRKGRTLLPEDRLIAICDCLCIIESSAFVTITHLFHCLYNTKITFMYNSLTCD